MSTAILPPGSFVWCRFPLDESPRTPGPENHLHLVYIYDNAGDKAVSIYTTTTPWPKDSPLATGVISVLARQAAEMGQGPFVMDIRRIGVLPVTSEWFPLLEDKDKRIFATATPAFKQKVAQVTSEIVKRKELIKWYGPGVKQAAQPQRQSGRGYDYSR